LGLAAVGVVAGLGAAAASSAPAAQRRPALRCQKLHGPNLVHSSVIKVVRRRAKPHKDRRNAHDLLACVRPRGKVYPVGGDGTETLGGTPVAGDDTTLGATVGTFLLTHDHSATQLPDTVDTYKVYNVRTGRHYVYFENTDSTPPQPRSASTPPPARVLLNRSGQLAGVFTDDGSDPRARYPDAGNALVIGFQANGRRRVLDRAPRAAIPPASLQVVGHTVRWTHAGTARSATL
jgi:hypothetical protein